MGRVTYVHHYVRIFLPVFRHSLLTPFLAPNTLLRRPHVGPSPRPLHLLVTTAHTENKVDILRSLLLPHLRLLLVV